MLLIHWPEKTDWKLRKLVSIWAVPVFLLTNGFLKHPSNFWSLMQLGFGRRGHQSLQEFCHRSSWAPDLMFSSGFSQISNIFFCFLESARSAQLCSLKQQMCWCILHFLTEWKRSLFSSQRLVIGKPWPVCARSLPRYSQYGNCGQVVAGVSRGGDGKGDLEHLNWKCPRPLCLTQVLPESLWPFEMLAPCCVAGVCVPYPPRQMRKPACFVFFSPPVSAQDKTLLPIELC